MNDNKHLLIESGTVLMPSQVRSFPVGCSVYAITNLVSGRSYYGSSLESRYRLTDHVGDLRKGKHYNQPLQKSWNKYGEENFRLIKIETCTKENVREREQVYLDGIQNNYNILKHAKPVPAEWEQTPDVKQYLRELKTGVPVHTLEQRDKWSKDRRGKPASPAMLVHIQKLADEARGKKLRPEHRDKVVAARDAYWATPESREQASSLRKQHPEWVAAAQSPDCWTEERRKAFSDYNKAHPEMQDAARAFARSEEGRASARKNIGAYNEWRNTPAGKIADNAKRAETRRRKAGLNVG